MFLYKRLMTLSDIYEFLVRILNYENDEMKILILTLEVQIFRVKMMIFKSKWKSCFTFYLSLLICIFKDLIRK